jgi:hypothetical protein
LANLKIQIRILPVVLIIFLATCEKERHIVRNYPIVKTLEPVNITTNGARFNAVIVSGELDSVTECGFSWGSSLAIDTINSESLYASGKPQSPDFSINLSHQLEINHKYFVRSYVKTDDLLIYGNLVTFTIPVNR